MRLKDCLDKNLIELNKEYTYTELCRLHKCETVKGNAWQADINELNRLYKVNKIRRGVYVFIEKYFVPLEGVPRRGMHPNSRLNRAFKYSEYVDSLLKSYLLKYFDLNRKKKTISYRTLACKIGLVNINMIIMLNQKKKSLEWIGDRIYKLTDGYFFNQFMDWMSRWLYSQIKHSLERFDKAGVIKLKKIYRFRYHQRNLSNKEIEIAKAIEDKALNDLDISIRETSYGKHKKLFEEKCSQLSIEAFEDVFYKSIQIELQSKDKLMKFKTIPDAKSKIEYTLRKSYFEILQKKNNEFDIQFCGVSVNEIAPWHNCIRSDNCRKQAELYLALIFFEGAPVVLKQEAVKMNFIEIVTERINENEFELELKKYLHSQVILGYNPPF